MRKAKPSQMPLHELSPKFQTLSIRTDHPLLNPLHWYQMRKRAVSRLRTIAGDKYSLIDHRYRGHQSRNWMRHDECQCVFLASLREAYHLGDDLCPFCFPGRVDDMRRFGSVGAVQELVHLMTDGRVAFSSENVLGDPTAQYTWVCATHKCELSSSFIRFIANPDALCKYCKF